MRLRTVSVRDAGQRLTQIALLAALSACADSSGTTARIDALEAKVEQVRQEQQANRASESEKSATFEIQCPSPWQALGPVGDAAWACRAAQALPSGWWPNCNVTTGPAEPSTAPKVFFEASLANVPQLRAARRLSERSSALDGAPAYEAIYEHDLMPTPLRVLATIALHAERAYAVSCSAPPEAFPANEALFRQITQSFRFRP